MYIPGVLDPKSFFTGCRTLEIFHGGMPREHPAVMRPTLDTN
jgi:hypothetical protein